MSLIQGNDILCETYSFAGKASLRQYNINLKRKTKKSKKMNFFVNSYIFSTKKIEDSLYIKPIFKKKIFKIDYNDSQNHTYKERNKNLFKGKNYQYHQKNVQHMNLKRNKIDLNKIGLLLETNNNNKPKQIRYVLNWKKLTGRKPINKEKENNYKNYSDINIKTDNYQQIGFVDMSKQTQRDDNFLFGDLRKRSGKKFVKLNFKLEKEKWKKFINKKLIPKSPLSSDFENIINNRKSPSSSKNKIKKIKKIKKYNSDFEQKKMNLSAYKQHSVINFEKSTGRQNLFNKLEKRNNTPRVILHPNYNSIEERVKMMVVYKNKEKKEQNGLRKVNWEDYYSTTESFENIYGHKLKSVPDFKQMMSRPTNNKLPTFMNGIHNRMYEYNLEMNLMNNYFTDKNEKDKMKNIVKIKKDENNKQKSKDILKKFINLYADTFCKEFN